MKIKKKRGGYNPYKRNRQAEKPKTPINGEKLVGCAIIREGVTTHGAFHTHAEVRRHLGDEACYTSVYGDEEGYWTSKERFVNRIEAAEIARRSGQTTWTGPKLLSCEVNWKA